MTAPARRARPAPPRRARRRRRRRPARRDRRPPPPPATGPPPRRARRPPAPRWSPAPPTTGRRRDRTHPPPVRRPTRRKTSEGVAGPSWTTSPSRSATQRSTRSTKAGSWVATTIAAPSWWSSAKISRSASLPGASRPTKGSSTSRISKGRTRPERDRRLLAEAAAEPGRQVVGAVGEPDPLEQLVEVVGVGGDAVQRGDVGEVLADGEVVVEHGLVGQEAHRGPGQRGAGRLAHDRDRPVGELEQAGGQPQEGGLARAVVPDQRDRLARRAPCRCSGSRATRSA